MFYPCPHCQFLVAYHPQSRPLPAACPRCGRPLEDEPGAGEDAGPGAGTATPEDASPAEAGGALATPPPEDTAQLFAAAPGDANAAPAPMAAVAPRRAASRWQWPLIALLALLLVVQVLLADRARLAADARWRPLVATLCGVFRCELPPWHEPAAFTMLDRQVRPAAQPGALRVDASFRNDARWAQAWPALQLALSDADGRVLGSRVFLPAEYLGAAPDALLSPGQSAQITFMVQEPAPGTVAFAFEFR
ncbi:DUF3426 domain-containing protein [Pseudoxanthomonas sp. J35]|uniref:DUF3426 domain-containing protein n=1 Tax=Pseudoxanthomonas sp. J35 TaxID=935852 RepID=UPI0004B2339A|nr:DUF3426 domain-containing protein [Pseudoxanthomonas sp. J35]